MTPSAYVLPEPLWPHRNVCRPKPWARSRAGDLDAARSSRCRWAATPALDVLQRLEVRRRRGLHRGRGERATESAPQRTVLADDPDEQAAASDRVRPGRRTLLEHLTQLRLAVSCPQHDDVADQHRCAPAGAEAERAPIA